MLLGTQMALALLCVSQFYIEGDVAVDSSDGSIARTLFFFQLFSLFLSAIGITFGLLAFLAGFVNRVSQLKQTMEQYEDYATDIQSKMQNSDNNMLLEQVTVQTPDRTKTLVNNLQLSLPPGESVVITGPSGCGKSSVLRAIGGLWAVSAGTISRPFTIGKGGVLFLPQTNYTTIGSLRDQIIYPHEDPKLGGGDNDSFLIDLLRLCGLGYLAERWGFDKEVMWDDQLSGEAPRRMRLTPLMHPGLMAGS